MVIKMHQVSLVVSYQNIFLLLHESSDSRTRGCREKVAKANTDRDVGQVTGTDLRLNLRLGLDEGHLLGFMTGEVNGS